jgi:hypothetical protein
MVSRLTWTDFPFYPARLSIQNRGCHDHELSSSKSTLLMLVSAFAGARGFWKPTGSLFEEGYRFIRLGMRCSSLGVRLTILNVQT